MVKSIGFTSTGQIEVPNVRKYRVSGGGETNTHLKAARWYTVSTVRTIHLPPSLSTAIHGLAISFLPVQIDMSSLDYIDQTSGAKWRPPLDTLPNFSLFSSILKPPRFSSVMWRSRPLWSSVWVNTRLKAAAGSFRKHHNPCFNCS